MHRSGYFRWTPRQQRIYADTLAAAANDDGHPTRDRVALLQTLARMPTSTLETLTPWLESTDVTLQEAALGASVWTATPTEAIPVLAAHLGGDRARVAMYAFQRCMRFLASGQLRRVLQVLLRESHKITVVKEVLRLHGRYRVDGAVDLLCGVLSDPSRHRDVRIAALSGLRDHLDSDGVFEAIASAVASESDLSSAIILDPTALASRHRRRWYALMEPLFQNEDPLVRQTAFAAGRAWLQACPREMACAAAVCIADLETGTEWRTACTLLSSAASDGIGHESVLEAIQQLTSCSQPHAEVHRDRPATQRRDALLNALLELPPHTQPRRAPLLQSLHALFSHDDAALLQMRIALHLTDDDHMATVLEAQAERIATHPEDLLEWATTTVVTLERIPGLTQRALSVASAAPWPARALAITLLGRVAATSGWTADLRSTLSVLRQDDDPRVRNRALRLYTHRE